MTKQPTDAPAPEKPPAAKGPSKLVNKATILGLIVAVILGECVAAFFFLGKGSAAAAADSETEAHPASAKPHHASGGDHAGHAKAKSHGSHEAKKHGSASSGGAEIHGDHKEVDLGEYSIMATDPASSTMLLVDFHIFGTVAVEYSSEFESLYEENRHRIRHQVIIIVRSAEMADLTDASLGLIRRQILEQTNQLLGKPLIEEIIFSKFSFIEQ
jgi:flagellar basal body-associated protein FliL